jgi:colanic acid/amylovoran biosynthesis protein
MIVEIHGAGFQNKGAELMLNTVIYELSHRLPGINFSINPLFGTYEERSKYGMLQLFPPRQRLLNKHFKTTLNLQRLFAPCITKRLTRFYGVVSVNRNDALIDISGFAYSDMWKVNPANSFAALVKVYKRQNKPIVLLPQAFGPFDREESKEAIKSIIKNVSLIYPRDIESFKHLSDLSKSAKNIHIATDITLFFPRNLEPNINPKKAKYCCIIPNAHVVEKAESRIKQRYFDLLLAISKEISRHSIPIWILIHDTTGADLEIVNQLLELFKAEGKNIYVEQVVQEEDPIRIKQIIRESLLIFGSRYHALISAFSQSVPSLCVGWAHKYNLLFQDFDLPELIIDDQTEIDEVVLKVNELLDFQMNESIRQKIHDKISQLEKKNQEMWDNVVQTLTQQSENYQ